MEKSYKKFTFCFFFILIKFCVYIYFFIISEKEKNDEMMKHMIEEAENQMVTLTNKVKEEVCFFFMYRVFKNF